VNAQLAVDALQEALARRRGAGNPHWEQPPLSDREVLARAGRLASREGVLITAGERAIEEVQLLASSRTFRHTDAAGHLHSDRIHVGLLDGEFCAVRASVFDTVHATTLLAASRRLDEALAAANSAIRRYRQAGWEEHGDGDRELTRKGISDRLLAGKNTDEN
jgi:hypothetical protein